MKLVLLTVTTELGEVQHRYVAKRLADAFGNELKAIIVATGTKSSALRKVKRYWRKYTLLQLRSRLLLKIFHIIQGRQKKRESEYRRILLPEGETGKMPRQEIVKLVPFHNGKKCLELLEKLQPDVIAVYGTHVIKTNVIEKARKSILNMHTGLSPRYRGSDTIFWALFNEEPALVGVTIHRIDAGIDSGAILRTAHPDISPEDTEDTLFAKCVKVGCDEYIKAIKEETEGISRAIPQNLSEGREYRSVERTMSAELRVWQLLRKGMLAPPRTN